MVYGRTAGAVIVTVGVFCWVGAGVALVQLATLGAPGPIGVVGFLVPAAGLGLLGWGFVRHGRNVQRQTAEVEASELRPSVEPSRVAPMPVPGPKDLDDLRFPIGACPQCGFLGIRAAQLEDGVVPGGGDLGFHVCPRCHYRGEPLEFRHAYAYRTFVQELHAL